MFHRWKKISNHPPSRKAMKDTQLRSGIWKIERNCIETYHFTSFIFFQHFIFDHADLVHSLSILLTFEWDRFVHSLKIIQYFVKANFVIWEPDLFLTRFLHLFSILFTLDRLVVPRNTTWKFWNTFSILSEEFSHLTFE